MFLDSPVLKMINKPGHEGFLKRMLPQFKRHLTVEKRTHISLYDIENR
jgi:hypothetical protein